MNTDLHYKVGLSFLYGIGPKKAAHLIAKTGSPEAVFLENIKTLHALTGIRKSVLVHLKRKEALEKADVQLEFAHKHNARVHYFLDKDYPRRLKHCDDAPVILYSKGALDLNPKRTLAVVGTRTSTDYGKMLCDELIDVIRDNDIQVISGLAYGIDICAHRACLNHRVQTIGVVGHGLDKIYPYSHKKTAMSMLENGGLITEFPIGTNPDRENFPMRNRIVAGMADAVVVVESRLKGGSLITAELANDYNKDVFAYPGNVGNKNSEGCHSLISDNKAHLIVSGKDLLLKMGWDCSPRSQSVLPISLSEAEKRIYDFLDLNGKKHADEIAIGTQTTISSVQSTLLQLELKGIVGGQQGSGFYLITK